MHIFWKVLLKKLLVLQKMGFLRFNHSLKLQYHKERIITVKDNPQLSDLKGLGTSKLDWRYFEQNRVDRNELQVCKNLHKGTGTKMTEKLNNLTEFFFCSCAFVQIFANLEFVPINFIVFKVPPVQFWSPWSLWFTLASGGLAYPKLTLW